MTSHPLFAFSFCPHCGSSHFVVNDARSKHCLDCGFVFYLNAAAAAAVLITDTAGRLLLTSRAIEPCKGSLGLPGGFAEFGESSEENARREVLEELNISLGPLSYLMSLPNTYSFGGMVVHTLDTFFLANLPAHSLLQPADDVASYQWFTPQQINPEQIGLDSARQVVVEWKKRQMGRE